VNGVACHPFAHKHGGYFLVTLQPSMDKTHLSVELVESLQRAIEKDRRVDEVVARLKSATLAGIVEYGCLRCRDEDRVPRLPTAIERTAVGQALLEVPTPLGSRAQGATTSDLRSLALRRCEFFVLATEAELQCDSWENFCGRFERAAWNQGFVKEAAANLHSALYEMASHALTHAFSKIAPLVCYEVHDGIAAFTVADLGVGVLQSLRSAAKYQYLSRDVDAIHAALHTGVTRLSTGGFGFNSVFKALAKQWGQLRFRSGTGCVSMDGLDTSVDRATYSFPPLMAGFQVSVCCRSGDALVSTDCLI
jgi:hypothetical protein